MQAVLADDDEQAAMGIAESATPAEAAATSKAVRAAKASKQKPLLLKAQTLLVVVLGVALLAIFALLGAVSPVFM